MTITAHRRILLGVLPMALVVGAVAGCNDSAPSVQAPASTAATAASTADQPTDSGTDNGVPTVAPSDTAGSSDTGESTDTGVPTVSAAPTSSSGDPSQVCTTDDSFGTPAAPGPTTKKAKWGSPLDVTQKYEGTVTMTPAKPVAKKGDPNDIFGPDEGQVYLLVKVTVKYKSGNNSVFGGTDFTLRDAKNNVCDYNSIADIVPQREKFSVVTIGATKEKTYSGTLVYEVPAGQDYTKYTFLYLPGLADNSEAPVAWTN